MWKRLAAALASLAVAGLLVPAAGSASAPLTHELNRGSGLRDFWTPERMARAESLDAPRSLLDPLNLEAARKPLPPFSSAPVGAPQSVPFRAAGKVFFKLGGKAYSCSAAIVRSDRENLIWTAGHCLRDPGLGGKFASKVAFIPAYDDGRKPFGLWKANAVGVPRGWGLGNQHYDFGAATLAKRNGNSVEEKVRAALRFDAKPKAKQDWTAVGYPQAGRFGDQMWSCESPFYRRDGFRGPGPDPIGIGCDMTGGASGGPWLTEKGKLGAVSSYLLRRDPDALYGTYLGGEAGRLYQRVSGRG